MGKVWIYRLLFVCVFVSLCAFVWIRISSPRIKLAASHFARRFIGVQGCESQMFVNISPQKPNIGPYSEESASARATPTRMQTLPQRCADVNVTLKMRRSWNRAACGRRIGMCGYTSIPEDGRIVVMIRSVYQSDVQMRTSPPTPEL